MQPDRFRQLRQQFSGRRLVVVGDVMLDTFIWGRVSRISPEAPVPIVTMEQIDHRPGGAANVAYNLRSLGADVFLIGVSGTDAAGHDLRKRLEAEVVLITRGPRGMDLFDNEGYHRIPSRARQLSDVCGDGDTVISTYALAFVSGANPREAAELANFAAGTVVEEMGVVPVSPEKMEGLLRHHATP